MKCLVKCLECVSGGSPDNFTYVFTYKYLSFIYGFECNFEQKLKSRKFLQNEMRGLNGGDPDLDYSPSEKSEATLAGNRKIWSLCIKMHPKCMPACSGGMSRLTSLHPF